MTSLCRAQTIAKPRRKQSKKDSPASTGTHYGPTKPNRNGYINPLLPARRLIAIYSAPKIGKSLLMLEMAVTLSRGEQFLGHTPTKPYRVLYVDYENDPLGDVRTRLQDMGYGPDDLDHLDYLSFPTFAALNSPRGAAELLAAVKAYASEVVVIDTVSRAIDGEENSNDTWLEFYLHTGLQLKQLGVAMIRLDHSGKDESQRHARRLSKSWRRRRLLATHPPHRHQPAPGMQCQPDASLTPNSSRSPVRSEPLRHELEDAAAHHHSRSENPPAHHVSATSTTWLCRRQPRRRPRRRQTPRNEDCAEPHPTSH